MSNPIITFDSVSVHYGAYEALHNVSLQIFDDDFLGIIGPNGGGKTTLIRALLGNIPYSGSIKLDKSLFEGGKRLIGYMPQISNFDIDFPITVEDVVLSGLQAEKGLFSRYNNNDRLRVSQTLSMASLTDIKDKQIGELSGGQLQRVLLCRAIILRPKLLILDEPTNFVDNRFENELYNLLSVLNKDMAIIMVSHDLGTITSVVKSILCVNRTVHRHNSNLITQEQLDNYHCPLQIVTHGAVAHTVLAEHNCNE